MASNENAKEQPRLKTRIRLSSSDIRQDDFYIDDDLTNDDSSDMRKEITSGSIAELLENLSSGDEDELESNWEEQLELEWDDSLIDTPLSTASSSNDFQSQTQKIVINGKEYRINCSIIAPFIEVLQHAGYTREGLTAVMVFQARKLPTKDCDNYAKIMHHLFLHFLLELSNLVADSYVLIVFTKDGTLPPLKWLRDCYRLISRPLRKSLRQLVVVEPTWWTKLTMAIVRPFVSAKFFRKIVLCPTIDAAEQIVDFDSRYARDMLNH